MEALYMVVVACATIAKLLEQQMHMHAARPLGILYSCSKWMPSFSSLEHDHGKRQSVHFNNFSLAALLLHYFAGGHLPYVCGLPICAAIAEVAQEQEAHVHDEEEAITAGQVSVKNMGPPHR
eukprot:1159497-Pelagomonas_calceolata.AAC.11